MGIIHLGHRLPVPRASSDRLYPHPLTHQALLQNWSATTPAGPSTDPGRAILTRGIDPSLCTHLVYAFAGMDGHQLSSVEWNDKLLYQELSSLKKM